MAAKHESSYEFAKDGHRYILRDVHLLTRGDTHLWNDKLFFTIDHRGNCRTQMLQGAPQYSVHKNRCFYVRDDASGEFWSAPHDPVQAEPDQFEFSAGLSDVQWIVQKDDIEVSLRLFIPLDDVAELWTVRVTNRSRRRKKLSLYSFLPFGALGIYRNHACYDAELGGILLNHWPYWTHIEEYEELRDEAHYAFCAANRPPTSYETSIDLFVGGGGLHDPAALGEDLLGSGMSPEGPAAGMLHYALELGGGDSETFQFMLAPAQDRDEALRLKDTYLADGAIDAELRRVQERQESRTSPHQIETPDGDFNHYVNHWLPRLLQLTGRSLRLSWGDASPTRNAIQDLMGLTYLDPEAAREWLQQVWSRQHKDGWMPHGLALIEGSVLSGLELIPHKDKNVWGPMVLHEYVAETGDMGLLHEEVPFADADGAATLYEHVCLGLEWLLRDRTERGLCRIGQGDWNDPLNMVGCEEKGESTWLTEALAFGLDLWAEIAERMDDQPTADRYRQEADACRAAVNEYLWVGDWYARGTMDSGQLFGVPADEEGKIYLNAQTWAMMCGAADETKIETCIQAIAQHLDTASGPMVMAPAYADMREDIGKIAMKPVGSTENGSVYCHAVAFYVLALYGIRRKELAWTLLRTLLTGGGENTLERTGQLPLYIPNFYYGVAGERFEGRSSHRPMTGTGPWYLRIVLGHLLGARAELDGLRIDPQLPKEWEKAGLVRRFRGADFNIQIEKQPGVSETQVVLDGETLSENLISPQEAGTRHEVRVTVPVD